MPILGQRRHGAINKEKSDESHYEERLMRNQLRSDTRQQLGTTKVPALWLQNDLEAVADGNLSSWLRISPKPGYGSQLLGPKK